MYAVVKVNGHQYKVTPGATITVDSVKGEVGQKLSFPALLVAENGKVKLGGDAAAVSVAATIIAHGQGEKIHIRRFRAKSRTRRHTGFRAQLTTLSIEAIGTESASPVQTVAPKEKPAKVRKPATKTQ